MSEPTQHEPRTRCSHESTVCVVDHYLGVGADAPGPNGLFEVSWIGEGAAAGNAFDDRPPKIVRKVSSLGSGDMSLRERTITPAFVVEVESSIQDHQFITGLLQVL